jgi:hypothetical protein
VIGRENHSADADKSGPDTGREIHSVKTAEHDHDNGDQLAKN